MPDAFSLLKSTISIHALRVEGDLGISNTSLQKKISIHALRVEGDQVTLFTNSTLSIFLSTPSGWRATLTKCELFVSDLYFYPRPPGGGRLGRMHY